MARTDTLKAVVILTCMSSLTLAVFPQVDIGAISGEKTNTGEERGRFQLDASNRLPFSSSPTSSGEIIKKTDVDNDFDFLSELKPKRRRFTPYRSSRLRRFATEPALTKPSPKSKDVRREMYNDFLRKMMGRNVGNEETEPHSYEEEDTVDNNNSDKADTEVEMRQTSTSTSDGHSESSNPTLKAIRKMHLNNRIYPGLSDDSLPEKEYSSVNTDTSTSPDRDWDSSENGSDDQLSQYHLLLMRKKAERLQRIRDFHKARFNHSITSTTTHTATTTTTTTTSDVKDTATSSDDIDTTIPVFTNADKTIKGNGNRNETKSSSPLSTGSGGHSSSHEGNKHEPESQSRPRVSSYTVKRNGWGYHARGKEINAGKVNSTPPGLDGPISPPTAQTNPFIDAHQAKDYLSRLDTVVRRKKPGRGTPFKFGTRVVIGKLDRASDRNSVTNPPFAIRDLTHTRSHPDAYRDQQQPGAKISVGGQNAKNQIGSETGRKQDTKGNTKPTRPKHKPRKSRQQRRLEKIRRMQERKRKRLERLNRRKNRQRENRKKKNRKIGRIGSGKKRPRPNMLSTSPFSSSTFPSSTSAVVTSTPRFLSSSPPLLYTVHDIASGTNLKSGPSLTSHTGYKTDTGSISKGITSPSISSPDGKLLTSTRSPIHGKSSPPLSTSTTTVTATSFETKVVVSAIQPSTAESDILTIVTESIPLHPSADENNGNWHLQNGTASSTNESVAKNRTSETDPTRYENAQSSPRSPTGNVQLNASPVPHSADVKSMAGWSPDVNNSKQMEPGNEAKVAFAKGVFENKSDGSHDNNSYINSSATNDGNDISDETLTSWSKYNNGSKDISSVPFDTTTTPMATALSSAENFKSTAYSTDLGGTSSTTLETPISVSQGQTSPTSVPRGQPSPTSLYANRWITWAKRRRERKKKKKKKKSKSRWGNTTGESNGIGRGSVAGSIAQSEAKGSGFHKPTSRLPVTKSTPPPGSPFIGYKTAYDFLSNQNVARGHTRNEARREDYVTSKLMGENMCEIFNKHFVPTRIGGKCV